MRFQAFRLVVLPQMRGGIAAVAAIMALSVWGEFFIPLVCAPTAATKPVTVLITASVGKYTTNQPLRAAPGASRWCRRRCSRSCSRGRSEASCPLARLT